ncbi:MAG: hypothetical protein RR092_05580 [Oscillospiraceae bacterium]
MEWEQSRIRLRRKVSAAVIVIDDFTGRPITGAQVAVTAEGMGKPVRKQDGYFLFLDCTAPTLAITARALTYHPCTVQVALSALPPLRPVVKIRLTPNRSYRIPQQTTCLEGTASPGANLRVFCENDPRPLRLLYDYAKGGEAGGRLIHLYDPTASDLEGKQFALLRKGEDKADFFEVQELQEGEEGACLMTAPLERDCKKAGTTILPVTMAQADEKGMFFLPLKGIAATEYQCRVLWAPPGGVWTTRTVTLACGRVTRLDLRDDETQSNHS